MSIINKAMDAATALALKAKYRADGWANAITGLGGSRDSTSAMAFVRPCYLTADHAENLYLGDDMAARIAGAVVNHSFLLGFSFQEDEDGDLSEAVKKWGVQEKVTEAAIWGRALGGAALLLGINQGRMAEPISPEQVRPGDLKYIDVLDRRDLHIVDYYSDPLDAKFGQPRTYQITYQGGQGGAQGDRDTYVHETRLVFFGGALTPKRVRTQNGGWDLSVLERSYGILRDTNTGWRAFINLMQDMSQPVFKVKDLMTMIASGHSDTLMARLEVADLSRSVSRSIIVDAEEEDFTHVGAANLTGAGPLLDKIWQRLAAAADMPVTILMGMSPAGMNATGESDMRAWFNTIQTYRENSLSPKLERLAAFIAASEGLNFDTFSVDWPSLWQMSPTEDAQHKATIAQTDVTYINAGVLLPEEVTQARWGRGEYSSETASAVDLDNRDDPTQMGGAFMPLPPTPYSEEE